MGPFDAVARPDHTGENRCWACTVVNVGIVAVVAVVLGRRRRGLGLVLFAVGLALVALRGYVVPHTPAFAPHLVERLGYDEYFDHAPAPGVATAAVGEATDGASVGSPDSPAEEGTVASVAEAPTGEELLGLLVERGVLAVDEEDAVAVEASTVDAWTTEMDDLSRLETSELVAAACDVTGVDGRAETGADHEYVVLGGSWLSRPVAIAEVAAARVVAERFDDRPTRLAAASALRMFLTECPDCGATLEETSTASCCGGYTEPTHEPEDVLACPDCGVWVYRFEAD